MMLHWLQTFGNYRGPNFNPRVLHLFAASTFTSFSFENIVKYDSLFMYKKLYFSDIN